MPQMTDLHSVVEALRAHDRFLVVTHENPDGDALGSLLATTVACVFVRPRVHAR